MFWEEGKGGNIHYNSSVRENVWKLNIVKIHKKIYSVIPVEIYSLQLPGSNVFVEIIFLVLKQLELWIPDICIIFHSHTNQPFSSLIPAFNGKCSDLE